MFPKNSHGRSIVFNAIMFRGGRSFKRCGLVNGCECSKVIGLLKDMV